MPTPTYDLIEEKVLGSAQASVTFSSIPGTYKDLVLEMVGTVATADNQLNLRFNGDTGSNYSFTTLSGNGTTASSGRSSNQTFIELDYMGSSTIGVYIAQIMSYANTNVNKTLVYRGNRTNNNTNTQVALWRSTSAITSILVYTGATTFNVGNTFRLWGVSG